MKPKSILIVDDDRQMIDVLKIRFAAEGYAVLAAYDGAEGLKVWRTERPDLILLDVQMPQVDGFSFLQEAKTRADLPPVPVIMLTGSEEMRGLFQTEGVVDYIVKPYDDDELLKKIRKHIGSFFHE